MAAIVVSGETNSFGAGAAAPDNLGDVWLLKLSASGSLLAQYRYGGAGDDVGVRLADPGWWFHPVGRLTSSAGAGGKDGWLVKLNAALQVSWAKTYGGSGDEVLVGGSGYRGRLSPVGEYASFGGGGKDFWVMKVDDCRDSGVATNLRWFCE